MDTQSLTCTAVSVARVKDPAWKSVKRKRERDVDREGHLGWQPRSTEEREMRASSDVQEWTRLPMREEDGDTMVGVGVMGAVGAQMGTTYAVAGTVNVLNTGKHWIRTWDKVYGFVARPENGYDGTYTTPASYGSGNIGTDDARVRRDVLTGFTTGYNPTNRIKIPAAAPAPPIKLEANTVYEIGTALMSGAPGTLVGVLLKSPCMQRI